MGLRAGVVAIAMLFIDGVPRAFATAAGQVQTQAAASSWPGEEMPLQLAVRTPQDLAVKALAERQYLLFNLLAGGKQAYDVGNFAVAATKWEALLRLPGLDTETDRVIRPLAIEARARAGGHSATPPSLAPKSPLLVAPAASGATAAPTGVEESATPAVPGGGPASRRCHDQWNRHGRWHARSRGHGPLDETR